MSRVGRQRQFEPAFRDDATGRVERSRYASGVLAPMHLLDGLPEEWIIERDAAGRACALKASIIAGFVRDGEFYTREEAASVLE